jgi:hypothetical protein
MAEYRHAMVKDGEGGHVVFPPFVTQKELDAISERFVVRDDDVFVVAYPKSGTTWMEQIVHLLANGGDQGDKVLSEAVPWVEGAANKYGGLDSLLGNATGRRFFHSHLPYALMPGVTDTRARYVYVARNPKDNAVSFYYHSCSKLDYEGSWEEFFELFIRGQVGYGLVLDHVLDWWDGSRKNERILFVKYEDMKREPAEAVSRVASFIGVRCDDELLRTVVDKSSFASMASNELANLDWVPQKEGVPRHMRKGIVGDWREHFSDEQSRRFDALYSQKMRGTGLRFDFGDGLVLPAE